MANLKIYGLPDILALPDADVIAGSQASVSMADDNLETEEPSEFWRSTGYKPSETILRAYRAGTVYTGADIAVSGVGLVNHNLWPETGQVRFALFSSQSDTISNMFETLVPDAITNSTNKDGTLVTAVDEGFSPDGAFMSPSTATSAWMVEFSFPTPSSPGPTVGANRQAFWIFAKSSSAVTTASRGMPMTVKLYDSTAGFVRAINKKSVCVSTGQWFFCPWDMQEVITAGGNADGSGVKIRLEFEPGSSATSSHIKLDSVLWHCDESLLESMTGYEASSEWLSAGEFVPFPGNTADLRVPGERLSGESLAYEFDAVHTDMQQIVVLIREDHSPNLYFYDLASLTTLPVGYVQAGKLLACPEVFSPSVNFAYGQVDGVIDLSTSLTTDAGQRFGSRRGTKRIANIQLEWLTQAEQAWIKDRLLRRRGATMPVLVQILPEDALEGSAMTFYATLRAQEHWGVFQKVETNSRQITLVLEEKL